MKLSTWQLLFQARYSTSSALAYRKPSFRPFLEALEDRTVPTTLNLSVTNTTDNGPGSFRQAILDANANPGLDVINFSIGSGLQTISITSALPDITDAVTIDGTSQPGYAGTPIIELSGAGAGAGVDGLRLVNHSGSTVRGLVINGFSNNGIDITGSQASENVVRGNYIGTDAIGMASISNGGVGIFIENQAGNNIIGGSSAGMGNVVGGNGGDGIKVTDSEGNLIQGNYVGVNANGTAVVANGGYDLEVNGANLIGGNTPGAGNIIKGSLVLGRIDHDGVVVQGNFLGTNPAGTAIFPNGGILVGSFATIGGTTPGAGNVIVGSVRSGLTLGGGVGNIIQGNYIGTNPAGATDMGNAGDGIVIANSQDNIIGGNVPGARNVISGNGSSGVEIKGSEATGNLIQGNYIGTDSTGTAPLGNFANGIWIRLGANNNTIGGAMAGARNVISGNLGNGIYMTGSGTTGQIIQGNFIGTDVTGRVELGNGNDGILADDIAGVNTLGGATVGASNVIAGNANNGIELNQSSGNDLIQGNYIGVNEIASASVANGGYDISVYGAPNVTIGGTASGAGNIIKGSLSIYHDAG